MNRSTVTDLEAFAEQWRLTQPEQVSIVRYFKHAFYGFEVAIQNSTDLIMALDEVAFSLMSVDNNNAQQQSLLQGLLDSEHVLTVEEVSSFFGVWHKHNRTTGIPFETTVFATVTCERL